MDVPPTESAPVAQGQQRIPSRWEQPRANVSDFTALDEQVGQRFESATSAVVRGIGDAGAQANDQKNIANAVWADGVTTDAANSFNKALLDNKDNAGKGLPDIIHNNVVQPYIQKALQDAQTQGLSPAAIKSLTVSLNRFGGDAVNRAISMEGSARADNMVNSLNDSVSKANDAVSMNPDQLGDLQSHLSSMVDGLEASNTLTPEGVQRYRNDVANLSVAAARSVLGNDPAKAQSIMDNAKGVEPNLRFAVNNEIKAAANTRDSVNQYNQGQLLESNLSSIEQTGVPAKDFDRDAYLAAQPANERAVKERELDSQIYLANAGFKITSQMDGATPAKIQQILDSARPVPGSSDFALKSKVFDFAQNAAKNAFGQMSQDLFGYSMRDPYVSDVQRRAQNLTANPNVAAPGAAIAAQQELIKASVGWQNKAGVAPQDYAVAPAEFLRETADKLNTATGEQVGQLAQSLQSAYGEYYPQLLHNLASLPPAQRASASVLGLLENAHQPWFSSAVQAQQANVKDYDLTPAQETQFKDALANDPKAILMKRSMFSGNAASSAQLNDFNSMILKQAYMFHASGGTPEEAVSKAVGRYVGSNYDFTEMNGHAVAVARAAMPDDPKTGKNGFDYTDADMDSIKEGMHRWLDNYSPAAVDKESFGLPADVMTPEYVEQKLKPGIQNNAFFFMNPDKRSYTLMLPSATGDSAQPLTVRGKPVTVKAVQLRALGTGPENPDLMKLYGGVPWQTSLGMK